MASEWDKDVKKRELLMSSPSVFVLNSNYENVTILLVYSVNLHH